MKGLLFPKTFTGKLSLSFTGGFFLCFILFLILVYSGQKGGEAFFDNLVLAIPISAAGLSGAASFVTGAISIVMKRERSVLVFAATVLGLLIILFSAGEIAFPH